MKDQIKNGQNTKLSVSTDLDILHQIHKIEPKTIFIGSVALYLHGLVDKFRDIDISVPNTENFEGIFILRSEKLKKDIKNHPGQIENSLGIKRDSFHFQGFLVDVFIRETEIDFSTNDQGLRFASIKDIQREYTWVKKNSTSSRIMEKCDYYLSLI